MRLRLRALLIHKGTKHSKVFCVANQRLRALLIHKGTKPAMTRLYNILV